MGSSASSAKGITRGTPPSSGYNSLKARYNVARFPDPGRPLRSRTLRLFSSRSSCSSAPRTTLSLSERIRRLGSRSSSLGPASLRLLTQKRPSTAVPSKYALKSSRISLSTQNPLSSGTLKRRDSSPDDTVRLSPGLPDTRTVMPKSSLSFSLRYWYMASAASAVFRAVSPSEGGK